MTTDKFEQWAVVELMGHQKIIGLVTEASIAGGVFLRVDVPEANGSPAYTRFYGASAVYCISPVAEDIARKLAANFRPAPVHRFELTEATVPQNDETVVSDEEL